ncbi:hypothetical protein FB45DRAFT_313027 [Roridomyces roridus]|uniref:Uncharacterized protein n=1 Tax=Roridomyces roridus TaxID=1738132 RepID=A0AAD7B5U2_9AGAR|nr:hypothetical protein FB45DRAFT_313027 [Roridomyces roridus]
MTSSRTELTGSWIHWSPAQSRILQSRYSNQPRVKSAEVESVAKWADAGMERVRNEVRRRRERQSTYRQERTTGMAAADNLKGLVAESINTNPNISVSRHLAKGNPLKICKKTFGRQGCCDGQSYFLVLHSSPNSTAVMPTNHRPNAPPASRVLVLTGQIETVLGMHPRVEATHQPKLTLIAARSSHSHAQRNRELLQIQAGV